MPTDWWADPSLCWFEWQTLVGGLFAVGAALVSVYWLNKQISQTEKLHQAELRRRHNAARAVVPVALAAISEFCSSVADQIARAIEFRREDDFDAAVDALISSRVSQKNFQNVDLPSPIVTIMKDFVETLSDDANVRHVAELLSSVQILQARFKEFDLQQSAGVNGLYGLLLDTAKVKLLTDSIYNYGRFVDENGFSIVNKQSVEDAWSSIQGKAQSLLFMRQSPDYFFPKISDIILSNCANQNSPWNEKFE
jgi:hypothetical protein